MKSRTVQMTAEQAALIARALHCAIGSNRVCWSDDELEELELLQGCAEDTAKETEDVIHGWCL